MSVYFETKNKSAMSLWGEFANEELRRAAVRDEKPEWLKWSTSLLGGINYYVQPYHQSGAFDPLQRVLVQGWKFYTDPLPTVSGTGHNTSNLAYWRMLDVPVAISQDAITEELRLLCAEMTKSMKWLMRIMEERQRRGFEPYMAGKMTKWRRLDGERLP